MNLVAKAFESCFPVQQHPVLTKPDVTGVL